MGSSTFAWAQMPPPSGNPIDTLPQAIPLPSPDWELPAQSNPTPEVDRNLQPAYTLEQELQVNNIQISGVSALPFEDIAEIFQPLSGTRTTIAALGQAVAQATQVYQRAGFPLSFAYLPEQNFANGIVQVNVVEGHLTQAVLQGDPGKSEKLLRTMAQPMLEQKPLNQAVFEHQTLLLSRLAHLQVSASAAPPTSTDGGTPLLLQLDRNPVLFNLGADLRKGDPKAVATLTFNEPLWSGSQWQFSSLIDNWNKERFVSVTFNQALNAYGTRLSISASDFKGQDNFAGNQLQDTTAQKRLSIGVTHPLLLSNAESSVVGANLFGLNYQKIYEFPLFNLSLSDQEKVRALQVLWDWQKRQPHSQQSANLSFTQGINALGARIERSPFLEKNNAKLDFSRLAFDYALHWRAPSLWGAGFAMGGQASPHSLPTSERISFGSTRFGRGYRSGEAAGDQGLGVSFEANRLFIFKNGTWLKSIEPYILYEQARTWFHQAGWQGQKIQSSSIGLKLSDGKHYAIDLAMSKPHGDKSPYNPDQKLRYSMTLTYQFGQ